MKNLSVRMNSRVRPPGADRTNPLTENFLQNMLDPVLYRQTARLLLPPVEISPVVGTEASPSSTLPLVCPLASQSDSPGSDFVEEQENLRIKQAAVASIFPLWRTLFVFAFFPMNSSAATLVNLSSTRLTTNPNLQYWEVPWQTHRLPWLESQFPIHMNGVT